MVLPWRHPCFHGDLHKTPMEAVLPSRLPWCFRGASMVLPWRHPCFHGDFRGAPMGHPWKHGASMGSSMERFHGNFCGASVVFPWGGRKHGASMGASMVLPWDRDSTLKHSVPFPWGFPWWFRGAPMGLPWTHSASMVPWGNHWCFHETSMGLP